MTDQTFYQLTFFDTYENKRKTYLNGTSWATGEDAESEYKLLKRDAEIKKRRFAISSHRIKWALEAVRNKKRIVIKTLY